MLKPTKEQIELLENWNCIMGYCDHKNCEKYKGVFYSANNSIKLLIEELIQATVAVTEERVRREVREFLANSSVWDSEYIYLRKAKMLDQFDEKFLFPNQN